MGGRRATGDFVVDELEERSPPLRHKVQLDHLRQIRTPILQFRSIHATDQGPQLPFRSLAVPDRFEFSFDGQKLTLDVHVRSSL